MFDNKAVRVEWDRVHPVPINNSISFDIDVGEATTDEVYTKIFNPLGAEEDGDFYQDGRMLTVSFIPKMIGNYIVVVQCSERKVDGSPFTCSAYDVTKVKLLNAETDGCVGDELSFVVDTSEAGDGDLDVEVLCLGQLVKTVREKIKNTCHKYKYRVDRIHNHYIDIMFNLNSIPGCPKEINMLEQTDFIEIDPETPNIVPAHRMNWLRLLCNDKPISVQDLTIAIHSKI